MRHATRQRQQSRWHDALILLDGVTSRLEADADRSEQPPPHEAQIARQYLDANADVLEALAARNGGGRRAA